MATDGQDDNPWTRPYAGPVHPRRDGFQEPPPPRPAAPPPAPRRSGRFVMPAVLAVIALAGVGIGVAMKPDEAPVAPPPPNVTLPVKVAALPPPPAPPASDEPLEVLAPLPPPPPALPPLAAQSAPAPRITAPAVSGVQASASVPIRPTYSPPPPRVVAPVQADEPAPPAPTALARNDEGPCGWAESRGQELVCQDRGLANADRRMRRAYERALRAGVPERELAEDQADWLNIREEAARHSRGAMVSVYNQRIGELEDLAERR